MRLPLLCLLALIPNALFAGMPMVTLNEAASLRLEAISFFVVVLLLVAWGIKLLWNRLARDIERLPRIGYKASLGLTVLWGLLFVLVLTMISGARELMTPGAWSKEGATYQLDRGTDAHLAQARQGRLEALRALLWQYAEAHDGALPPHDLGPEIPAALWQSITDPGVRYVYVPGATADAGRQPVVYEPGTVGVKRYVLFSDGSIEQVPLRAIVAALKENT